MLKDVSVRLIVNVDPAGESGHTQEQVVELCKKYFPVVVSRAPEKASFSDAVKWAWSQVESEYFLHLEDDWCLKKRVDLNIVLEIFSINDLAGIRFNLTKNRGRCSKQYGFIESDGLSLNPTIFRTSFIKSLLLNFDINKDPEKQFRPLPDKKLLFFFYGFPGETAFVIDTGKKWRKLQGFEKWSPDLDKITWKRKKNSFRKYYYLAKYKLYLFYWNRLYCQ